MKSLPFIFVINFLNFLAGSAFADDVIVTLPNGQVRGHELKTNENKTFYGFQGIPYAAPPVGDLRFQAPVPPENWDGVWDATKDGDDCLNKMPQNDHSESEDCLFINIYTPNLNSNATTEKLLPVMFWIYGGGFVGGTSIYDVYGPDYLIQEDVVFVSFNYRLGPFGFLSTEDIIIPGNAGLKDQNMALKWTHQNIHLFGGDPEKITIFGESAGSASVTYHLLSEKSAGLFRGAIAESGTALLPSLFNLKPKNYALQLLYKVAENHNLTIDNSTLTSTKLLEILRAQTAETIVQADNHIYVGQDPYQKTAPCLEIPHQGAFVTESSFESLNNGKFNQVPTIMGMNSEEWLMFMGSLENLGSEAKNFDQNPESLIPVDLALLNTTNATEVAQAIKSIYLESDQLFADHLLAALKYGSDNMMTRPIMKHATLQRKYSDLYFYHFSYQGSLGSTQNYTIDGVRGVGHTEELPYLFRINGTMTNTTDLSKFPAQDVLVQKRFVKMWTNFAKYLNPTPEASDLLQNTTWPVLKNRGFQYLDVGENLTVVKGYPRGNSFHLWNTIYNKYCVKPFYTF